MILLIEGYETKPKLRGGPSCSVAGQKLDESTNDA
jgi:hypothetical protein